MHSNSSWLPPFQILIIHQKPSWKSQSLTLPLHPVVWKNKCWLKSLQFKILTFNRKKQKSWKRMLLIRNNFWIFKTQFWNLWVRQKVVSMKFWWIKHLLISSNLQRSSQHKLIKEWKTLELQKLKLIKQDNRIDQSHIVQVYCISVFWIYAISILCISILCNGSVIFSYWDWKIHHLQMFLKRDLTVWMISSLIVCMKIFADHSSKNINLFSLSC